MPLPGKPPERRLQAGLPAPQLSLIYLSLLANVVVFFHKPLFSSQYLFPWDFRGVQLPLISFLVDELRHGRFALWNPYNYCGYPVFANIEACYFHPLILLCALIASHSTANLPQLLEWAVAIQVWAAGIAAYHFLRELAPAAPRHGQGQSSLKRADTSHRAPSTSAP